MNPPIPRRGRHDAGSATSRMASRPAHAPSTHERGAAGCAGAPHPHPLSAGRRCGVCGEPLGVRVAFVGGERSIANRLFSDLPMHLDCARYALQVCPFLAAPKFHYQNKVPDGTAVNLHVSEERPKRFGLGVTRGYRPTWLPGNQVALEAAPFESIEWWVGGLQVDPAGNPT